MTARRFTRSHADAVRLVCLAAVGLAVVLVAVKASHLGVPALAPRALVDHVLVAEAAVAARFESHTGQAIVAFVSLVGGEEGSVERLEELRNHVAKKIGPIAKPANIVFTQELPKTRSGKIMRRLLRDVAENRPLGDTTTLADPTVVEEIRDRSVADAPDE